MIKTNDQTALRNRFKAVVKLHKRAQMKLLQSGVNEWEVYAHLSRVDWSQFTELTCGARTRAGTPCKQRGLYSNGRCKLHGGLSTGPRTEAGKASSARNGCQPKQTP